MHILYFLLLVDQATGQGSRQYAFTHYSVSSGLASNETTAVLQDEQGFIWIGTNNGLQRFDGQRYLGFRHQKNDPSSIPHNYITQLLFDQKNRLWILTGDGKLGIFDTKKMTWQPVTVKVKNEKIFTREKKLMKDGQGNLFLLYYQNELIAWNENKKEFAAAHNFIPVPDDWKLSDIIQQPGTQKYWVGSNHGIAVFNLSTGQWSFVGHNVEKEPLIEKWGHILSANNFYFDKRGRLWFDAWLEGARVFAYDVKKNEPVLDQYDFLSFSEGYYETKGFFEQTDSTVWVKGLNVFARYQEKEKKFVPVYNGYVGEQSIDYDKINFLLEDRDLNIWVATNNNGLYSFNTSEQFFSNIRHINRINNLPGKGSMMSFILTRNRTLLAGAWGDGLYRYDSNYRVLPLKIKGISEKNSPSVWGMCLSADSNTIWLGAQPGVYALNQVTQSATWYNPAIMQNRTVRQVASDKFGNLWMGTQGLGVFKWTAKAGRQKFEDGVSLFSAIPPVLVTKILICNNGYVWVGTSDQGLYVIDPATDRIIFHFGTREPVERKLPVDAISSIMQYDDTSMVIASSGLHFFNSLKKQLTRTINYPESTTGGIASMEKDKNGYIWISMTNGIYRVHPRNQIFVHFSRTDGIINDHFTIAASLRLPSGRIVFGADNQFVIFDPLKVTTNDPAPDVVITGFKLMNQSLLVDSLLKKEKIELKPESNSLVIEFSGMGYGRAFIIKYMLEGLDKEWIVANSSNQAVYSYLPPGNYNFLVKSEDAEGNPSNKITALAIKLKPPFWKTWWFLGLTSFAAVGIFYWLDKQRTQKIRATESIRTRIATSLTEDMSNSLSSINISSELAKTKVDTDTERTKEYIAQISDASNRMVQSMYDMVWSINPGNDNLQDTIARMKEFAVEVENAHDISLIFDIDKEVVKRKLNMENRYELLSIFKEAVKNAARHSYARNIQVSLRFKNPKLIMMVEDDGKGFEDLQCGLLGRGISDMRRRAGEVGASLYIESNVNTGSIVKLEMNI